MADAMMDQQALLLAATKERAKQKAMQDALAAQAVNDPNIIAVVPDETQESLAAKVLPLPPEEGSLADVAPKVTAATDPEKGIAGLSAAEFATLAGGIAQALAPPDAWQSRLGALAAQMGKGATTAKATGSPVKGAELKKAEKKRKDLDINTPLNLDIADTLLGR